jgi:hypothetical protein
MVKRSAGERGTGRLRRRLFTFLSAASLLLCLGVCALWVRERRAADVFHWQTADESTFTWRGGNVCAGQVGIYVSWQWYRFSSPGQATVRGQATRKVQPYTFKRVGPQPNPFADYGSLWNRIGFGRFSFPPRQERAADGGVYSYTFDSLHVPYWAMVVVFLAGGVPSVRWLIRSRRRSQWSLHQRCPDCGYDLRATPDCCPECGRESAVLTGQVAD